MPVRFWPSPPNKVLSFSWSRTSPCHGEDHGFEPRKHRHLCDHRLAVRSSPFHDGNRGSNPLGRTNYALVIQRLGCGSYKANMVVRVHPRVPICSLLSGYRSVWLDRLLWEQDVGSSNLSIPTNFFVLR